LSREVASLVGLDGLNDGRSTPGARMVRQSVEKMSRDEFCLWRVRTHNRGRSALGRGRTARAVTASCGTQSLHSDSLVYKGGQSGF